MDKKIILAVASVVAAIILIFGYVSITNKAAPDIGNFVEGISCSKSGDNVTIVSKENTQVVITFSKDGSKVIGFKFYQTPVVIGSRSIPLDLIKFVDKYKYLINFAKECFIDTIP